MTAISTNKNKKKRSSTQIKLYLDIVLFIGMVLVLAPGGTGIPVHEWASWLIIIPLLAHVVLDWKWVVNITKRLFKKLPGETRFNYVWDWLFFVVMTLAMFTGALISEAAIPAFGIKAGDHFWVEMHHLTANLSILIMGVHVAMHLKWITTNIKKYMAKR